MFVMIEYKYYYHIGSSIQGDEEDAGRFSSVERTEDNHR